MLRDLLPALLDLVFPPVCILCARLLDPSSKRIQICPGCRARIVPNRPPFCQQCSRPLPRFNAPLCRVCRNHRPHFDSAWSACLYNDTLRHLLHLFKYHEKTGLRHFFSRTILEFISYYRIPVAEFDLIVPVPLHRARMRTRGYNQSLLLAEQLAHAHRIPLSRGNLRRARNTRSQTALSSKDRWTNIQSAFTIKYPVAYKDKNILLVDDLLTTGATTSEASKILKLAGARKIVILTLAITTE